MGKEKSSLLRELGAIEVRLENQENQISFELQIHQII